MNFCCAGASGVANATTAAIEAMLVSASLIAFVGSLARQTSGAEPRAETSPAQENAGQCTTKLRWKSEGQGTPVVLLHGFGANSYSWRNVVPELSKSCRVITVDLKGFGESPKPNDGRYSIHDQGALVRELIREEDLRDVTLVGHSYGGGVALSAFIAMANDGDRRICRLILIDSLAYPQTYPWFIKVLRTPVLRSLSTRTPRKEREVRKVLEACYYDTSRITEDQVAQYAVPTYSPGATCALRTVARQIAPPDLATFVQSYRTIDVPTLIIWGSCDRIVPLDIGRRLNEAIPKSKLVVIDECGHIPHEEQPDRTLDIMRDFLERGNCRHSESP